MEPLTCLTLRIFFRTCNNVNSVIDVFIIMMMIVKMTMMMMAIGNAYSSSQIITTVIKKSAWRLLSGQGELKTVMITKSSVDYVPSITTNSFNILMDHNHHAEV